MTKNQLYWNSRGIRHFLSFSRKRETMFDKGCSGQVKLANFY